jgi:hypothetical protein
MQRQHHSERICGDVFLTGRVIEENRIVAVLSDGMGHGIKASVLATLTATMALNFTKEHKGPEPTAEIIMKTLPESSDRKMNYATFTIIDIDHYGKTSLLEYDNPGCIVIRNHKILKLNRKTIELTGEHNAGKKLKIGSFYPKKGDRIIFASDGVSQSGLGTPRFPFGWGMDNAGRFALDYIKQYPKVSARNLAEKILNMAYRNDGFQAQDDISSGVIYYREPRQLLICTGPPFEKKKDQDLAQLVHQFQGKKIVMGATTGDIIARELNLTITDGQDITDPDLPPISFIEGIDLYTEGILTLSKVEKILKKSSHNSALNNGPADEIMKLLFESDEILIVIGTRINIAHQSPEMDVDLEIRKIVVKRIASLLEERFLKDVKLQYI